VNIVDRVKNILLTPKTEWDVIAAESTPQAQLIVGYVLPLAAISAVAAFLGSIVLFSSFGVSAGFLLWGLVGLAIRIVMAVVMVFVVGFLIDALAVQFGGQKNFAQAFKVAVYSFTAAWVAGVLAIIPFLGWLLAILGSLYGLYLLYLGLPKLMKNPEEKSAIYTVVVVVVAIVVMIVVNVFVGLVSAPAMMGAAKMSGGGYTGSTRPSYDKGSSMAKLEEFGKKMEEAGKKMEAAQKSGDPNKQAQATMEVLGTAISGGRQVEPLSLEDVKGFVPETFAGLPRTSQSAERSGMATLMVATAKASYGDRSGKSVRLEVTDSGGASAMMGLAAWAGAMNVEKEDDRGSERTRKDGNRLVHERVSKTGGDNEFSLVLADRFIVKAVGSGVDLATLKGGVSGLNLAKLESLKDAGVAKN
jgi:signal transduction histidine kinase